MLRFHGSRDKQTFELIGHNSRLDELQAAILRVQLPHLDEWADGRRRAGEHYREAGLGELVDLPRALGEPVWHLYVVQAAQRDGLRAVLAARGIETGVHYPVPIHRQPAWLSAYGETPALPRAEQAAREMLSLPVHADLTDAEVERVAGAVMEFVRR
jgi:dTDP-4-amino-4,6-dideoxygalactose transaminase